MKWQTLLAGVLAGILLLCLTACCGGEPTAPTDQTTPTTSTVTEEPTLDKTRPYRLLFIGNSYTYYNDLWDIVAQIAADRGYTFEVDHVTQGGYYLDQYLNPNDPFGAQVAQKLGGEAYDYVFVQEQSTCPIVDYDRFEAAVTQLHAMVEDNGAACVLYQTWGRKTGSPTLQAYKWTNKSMTYTLIAAYKQVADTLGASVSPVGAAFYDVHTNHTEIELYDPDTTHPSLEGSYLAALCHVATITGVDPRTVTYTAQIDAETTAVLQQAAFAAVFE